MPLKSPKENKEDEDKKELQEIEMHTPLLPVPLRIDGANFSDLHGFYDEIERATFRRALRGRTLTALKEALDEIVSESGPVAVVWVNSKKSREDLGYPETIRQLETELLHCHPSVREQIREDLSFALRGEGKTVFSWLTETMASRKGVTVVFE